MAKELPYFQFEPAEYLTKDISFCSLSAQGLFINICAFYWQRECNLTKSQVLRRFNYPDVLKELINENIIKADENDNIIISFLLTQYEEIIDKKSNDSEKGKIGNLKRWHKSIYDKFIKKELSLKEALEIAKTSGGDSLAIAKTSQIREDKIREDKIREDKIREEEIIKKIESDFNIFWDSYGKKVDSKKCREKFFKLSRKDIDKILEVVDEYIKSTPDDKFRKNPLTWLNGSCWNDVVYKKNIDTKKKYSVQNAFGRDVVYLTDLEYEEKSKDGFNNYKLIE